MEDDSFKGAQLRLRMSLEEKEKFYSTCARKGVKPSQMIRDLIHAFCIKNFKYSLRFLVMKPKLIIVPI